MKPEWYIKRWMPVPTNTSVPKVHYMAPIDKRSHELLTSPMYQKHRYYIHYLMACRVYGMDIDITMHIGRVTCLRCRAWIAKHYLGEHYWQVNETIQGNENEKR